MNTDTTNVEHADTDASLPSNTVFELLLEDRRRYTLYYLSRKVGTVTLDDVVDRLAHREGTPTRDRREEIRLEFHHNHLPKLTESDVVAYDPDAETIERKPAARALDSYLELAFVDDLR
ncbi:DUF7344 domain-containing protein [Natronorubrum aibiense]|uniref:DUF7344 domain-containing protein n=1 Tax=Natronorubrum aibiense TaxID=348826 RepID=A0A5P9P3A2_9EURY|nr:hypothetical protein [Natronorubrum aibiense]QFU82608.1 hypothetical protein GCU68_08785 [Natronorubrum aibiense]